MRPVTRAAALLALALTTTTSPAEAYAWGCATDSPISGWTSSPPSPLLTVTGALGFSTTVPCSFGVATLNIAHTCVAPAPAEYVVNGAYCGPAYVTKSTINCAWDPIGLVGSDTRLIVGFDLNGDGNVTGSEPMSLPSDNGNHFKTPSVPGRVIGFPVSLSGALYPLDKFLVRCW